jgi:Domain of unknown function (DUF4333)
MRMAGRMLPSLLVVAVMVTGCAGKSLDTGAIADDIATKLSAAGEADITVECPDNVKVEAGASFHCTATTEGEDIDIVVTQENDEGDVIVKRAHFPIESLKEQVAAAMEFQLPDATVECPADPPVGAGNTFICRVSSKSQSVRVKVTQVDDFGNFTYTSKVLGLGGDADK